MILNFEASLVTEGLEVRISDDYYSLKIEGYRCYSMDQAIEIKKYNHSTAFGKAKVTESTWKQGETHLIYQLLSLKSVN